MSDDIIKRLREAIAAGPTPGPWHHKEWGSQIVDDGVGSSQVLIAKVAVNTYRDQGRHNATYIAAASPDNIAALLDRLDAAEAENERLRKFAGKVLDKSRRGFLEVSCGDIEDWAKQFGLLGLVTMSAACGDDCKCPEWVGFPLECLRPTALGSAAINAARAAEPNDRRDK